MDDDRGITSSGNKKRCIELRKKLAWLIIISMVISPLVSLGTIADFTEKQTTVQQGSVQHTYSADPKATSSNPEITIVSPKAGCLYLFKLQPINMPIPTILGLNYAVVIGRSLTIDTITDTKLQWRGDYLTTIILRIHPDAEILTADFQIKDPH
jgi:hypothetical protein